MRISDWSSDVCSSDLHSSGGTPVINNKLAVAALTGLVMAAPAIAEARDQIRIVGSSTVFPYTQAVSEEFANKSSFSAPVVESTGTGGGMKIFCQGVGADHPDRKSTRLNSSH